MNWAIFYPRSFYLLGRAHEQKEELELARNSYRTLLEIWKYADEDLPTLIDAKDRLAQLETITVR